jgi:hypothetical protein
MLLHQPASRCCMLRRSGAGDCATEPLLEWLGQLYGLVGAFAPRLDVVPLLPFAGWTPGERRGSAGCSINAPLPVMRISTALVARFWSQPR